MIVFWALPQALVVCELATKYEHGYNDWVTANLGYFVGFAHSLIRVLFALLTNAIYADLFVWYLTSLFGIDSWGVRMCCVAAFEVVVVSMNMIGLQLVGKASAVFVVLVLAPFVSLLLMVIPDLKLELLVDFSTPIRELDVSLLLSIFMFNLVGWDFVGNISGAARKPSRDVPIAIFVAMFLIFNTYTLPLLASVSVVPPEDYDENLFVTAAAVVFPPFRYVVSCSAFLGITGLATSFMSTSSEAIANSYFAGYVPKPLAYRFTKRNAPWLVQIAQGLSVLVVCSFLGYDSNVQLQMYLYSLSTVAIMTSFLIMRWHTRSRPAPAPPPNQKVPAAEENGNELYEAVSDTSSTTSSSASSTDESSSTSSANSETPLQPNAAAEADPANTVKDAVSMPIPPEAVAPPPDAFRVPLGFGPALLLCLPAIALCLFNMACAKWYFMTAAWGCVAASLLASAVWCVAVYGSAYFVAPVRAAGIAVRCKLNRRH
eukprot:TRINITY_DN361_c0_g1_i1.p1 TRINITY_DN361_c0_g1~~TRINITY_DN361_c0_g1_i1.p1  ORF type:complete len:487 (-),score=128.54 TRINITY_DN361_c0_g1_i1:105-1565(-)